MTRPHVLVLLLGLSLSSARELPAQTLDDPSLDVDVVTGGLSLPTTMDFLAPNDILVLEKNTGNVRRVLNGVLAPLPVLSVPVNFDGERGLLGIAIDTATPRHVFLFYTEAATLGGPAQGNRVYRYDWNPGTATLTDQSLVLDLPVGGGFNHNGGVLLLGPTGEAPGVGDGSLLYAMIGDLIPLSFGQLQNLQTGAAPNDTSVILRVRQNGTPAPGNPFTPYCSVTPSQSCTSNANCPGGEVCRTQVARYYAYGVRNGFGMALDPMTGQLWDTENGPASYDEINRVSPGMNSGWMRLMGPSSTNPGALALLFQMPNHLPTYDEPEFSFRQVIAPTAIVFPHQSALGPAYDDVAIVGDVNTHRLYALPLNGARSGFDLAGYAGLGDLVADDVTERNLLSIGTGFPTTDLEIGPDGALYVVSIYAGSIYRISGDAEVPSLPLWAGAALIAALCAGGVLAARSRAI